MKRNAFNGGEISPEMALRDDMDVYARSCSKLTNFDVSQMGGIKRRRGMRPLELLEGDAPLLLPYTYNGEHVYLVELHAERLVVRSRQGDVVASFEGNGAWFYPRLDKVGSLQINALLLLTSPDSPVMELRMDAEGSWTFGRYVYKMPPWYTVDAKETEVKVSPLRDGSYRVLFDEQEHVDERTERDGDLLRVSYFTQQKEAFAKSADLRKDVAVIQAVTPNASFEPGDKIAIRGESVCSYWVCSDGVDETVEDKTVWRGARDFVEGLASPANYPDTFTLAEDLTGFDEVTPIYKLDASMNFKRGDKIAIQSGYWEYYTCVRSFSPSDYKDGKSLPEMYPSHFIRGLACGEALPCRGTWNFYCSGRWYGSYEVRRCYDGEGLERPWEMRGESYSRVNSSSNEQISGNEEEEECWLRLFLTRSQYLGLDDIEAGFPADSCGNKLIVNSYVHDMLLECRVVEDDDGRDVRYRDTASVGIPLEGDIITADWSWAAFSSRYGFPTVAVLHGGRLILAATEAQPQTLWFSAVDDLNNFDVGPLDGSGLLLTMATSSQAGICWACSRGDIIMLGTEGAEWCVKGGDGTRGGALTAESVRVTNYGNNGSAHIPALMASDSVLYVERGDGRVFKYGFNFDSDSYTSTDLSVFAPHIAEQHGGIVRGTEIRKPDKKAVFVMGDGTLALMTYNSFHNVNAWHIYETQGVVKSACALPDGQNADRLYLVTERDSGMFLEVIDSQSAFEDGDGLDYVSTMESTAFSAPQVNAVDNHFSCFHMFIGEDCPKKGVEVMAGASRYGSFAHFAETLARGWVKVTASGDWTQHPVLGIRCRGNRGLHILAVQA